MNYYFSITFENYYYYLQIYKNSLFLQFKNNLLFLNFFKLFYFLSKLNQTKKIFNYNFFNTKPKQINIHMFLFFFWKNFFFTYLFFFNKIRNFFLLIFKKTIGDGFLYIRGLFIIFFIDMLLIDDEPLWEPLEWSLVQSWILFIFIFAWIAENLITSRFGSYTGRDKRVWFAWYKTFWFVEILYLISYGLTGLLVITPFYYELTYHLSFIYSWWHWYTRIFFWNFLSLYFLILLLCMLIQIGIRWLNWKKLFFFIFFINLILIYLLYAQFFITFFAYFTDPKWYQKSRMVDSVQLSHEPLKWGWGTAKRDHFTYHKVTTVFWFKNDGPFAGAFLMFNFFFFLSFIFVYIYWLILLRRLYTIKELSFTYTTFAISALKQFYYCFFFFYILIIFSFIVNYWRFPIEFFWLINKYSWISHFFSFFY